MIIDVLCLLACILAVIKGYTKGLVLAVFSLAGIVVGLLLAMRLSVYVSAQLNAHTKISSGWIPFIAFAIVLIATLLLIRIGAGLIQKSMEWAMLGWVNKLGGIIFFGAFYLLLLSAGLFFLKELHVIEKQSVQSSKTYAFIQPIAPKMMDLFGKVFPVFQGMFDQLGVYFSKLTS